MTIQHRRIHVSKDASSLVSDRCWCRTSDTGASAVIRRIGDERATVLWRTMRLICSVGFTTSQRLQLSATGHKHIVRGRRGGHKMPCMAAPLCGNWMAGRRGVVISWRHSSSIVRAAAVSQATQAGTSRHVMNALGPLLNTGTSHSSSSTVAGEVECYLATPAVDWWREKKWTALS